MQTKRINIIIELHLHGNVDREWVENYINLFKNYHVGHVWHFLHRWLSHKTTSLTIRYFPLQPLHP